MSVVPTRLRAPARPALHVSAFGLALALAGSACGSQTGIMLEVHKDDGVSSEVYELKVFVGVGHDPDLYDPAWRVAATLDADVAQVMLDGELGAGIYRVLLEPGAALAGDQDLVFAVAGYKTGQTKPVVFGHAERPVQFADGQVRVIDLPLATFRDARHGVTATGCAWWNDGGDRRKDAAIVPREDGDCDAFKEGHDEATGCRLDCDDGDPAVHPGATEICANGVDENCCADNDGSLDLDADGFATCGAGPRDCVDGPRGGVGLATVFGDNLPPEAIHPGAPEACDGVDNDCDAACDEVDSFDGDRDGYLNCVRQDASGIRTAGVHRVGPAGATCAPSALDCADQGRVGAIAADAIHPGAADNQCDGVDQDCDGSCDQQLVGIDGDGDGFDVCTTEDGYLTAAIPQCARGVGEDCGGDDSRFEYPGGAERCDGIDFDCDRVSFPALSPCFVVATDGMATRCEVGRRTCNDVAGAVDPGFGACVHDPLGPAIALPMAYCQEACGPTLDPIQCLSIDRVDCTVRFQVGAGGVPSQEACATPVTEVALPADAGPGGCNYTLIGGRDQGDWAVTLANPVGVTGTTATGCGSTLRVVSASPDAERRTVLVVSGQAPHVFRLERLDGCSDTANMRCGGP